MSFFSLAYNIISTGADVVISLLVTWFMMHQLLVRCFIMCILYVWENDQVHQPTQIIIILCSARRRRECILFYYYYINAQCKVEHQKIVFTTCQQKGHCMRASVDVMPSEACNFLANSAPKNMRENSQHFVPNWRPLAMGNCLMRI